uniref:TIL domain-containing protein n=1 Tax=Caenorhabditis tropicalis TaxID=1561998 RepID=A0A1I7T4K9_9PELO
MVSSSEIIDLTFHFQKVFIALCFVSVCIATNGENECPSNEVFKTCGTACEPTCENPNTGSRPCIQVCIPNKCQCAKGFVRNSNGVCVQFNQCEEKVPKCSENEEFKECGTHCEPTCENPSPACIKMCKPNVCQCSEGYLRHNNVCIPANSCPKKNI